MLSFTFCVFHLLSASMFIVQLSVMYVFQEKIYVCCTNLHQSQSQK